MFRGKLRHEWDQVSTIWQVIAESNRDREKSRQPYTVYDVHPIRGPNGDKFAEPVEVQEGRFWADIGWATRFSGETQAKLVHAVMERQRGR